MDRSRNRTADFGTRIAAARALGERRFERRRGPASEHLLPPMIQIQGGTFPIGSDEGLFADEAPAHRVPVDTFAIGQWPVTNAEWRVFLESGGYDDERWWDTAASRAWRRGEGAVEEPKQEWRDFHRWLRANPGMPSERHRMGSITSTQRVEWDRLAQQSDEEFEALLEARYPPGRQTRPAFWDDPAFNHPSHPVVGVCWFEARAYCAWLSASAGHLYRLPTEVEWEAAARGPQGRRYAWADDFDPARCNVLATHVGGTTPPGVFPDGDTPEGLVDMTGNVWEWTASAYQSYPYRHDDGREEAAGEVRRVARGGSWRDDQGTARASYRFDPLPDLRYHRYSIGFRMVRVSPVGSSPAR